MEIINSIIAFVTSDTVIKWVAALWLLEQALRAISELTVWKWDDNLVKILSKILKGIGSFIKKPTA